MTSHADKSEGTCYKTTFGDWRCYFSQVFGVTKGEVELPGADHVLRPLAAEEPTVDRHGRRLSRLGDLPDGGILTQEGLRRAESAGTARLDCEVCRDRHRSGNGRAASRSILRLRPTMTRVPPGPLSCQRLFSARISRLTRSACSRTRSVFSPRIF